MGIVWAFCLLRRISTSCKECLILRFPLQPTWDLTIHSLSGCSVLAGTHTPLQLMGPPNPPPLRPSVLADTPPGVHYLRGSAFSLAHRPMFGFDIICNSPSPLLADIVLFGLPPRGFHVLIKNVLFPSSTDVGSDSCNAK